MAFNLKKVLKALLLSSNQPLSIKDIQAVFTRFHKQALVPIEIPEVTATAESQPPSGEAPATPPAAEPAVDPAEIAAETPQDPELYGDVPTLVTATQIREVVDEIAAELRTADDGLLL